MSDLTKALDMGPIGKDPTGRIATIEEAAGLVDLLMEDCQTCGGSGRVTDHRGRDHQPGECGQSCYAVCPVCLTRGWNPTDQAIELAVNTFWAHAADLLKPTVSSSGIDRAIELALVAVLSMGDTE